MKAEIAVATVSGKAYYLIVDELKRRNVPFVSITPHDPVPMEVKVVITTEKERPLINHENVLTLKEDQDPQALVNQAIQQLEGKTSYEKIVIGVDPGEVLGVAVLADGKVIKTGNCFSIKETVNQIENIIGSLKDFKASTITVRVGNGVPEYKEKLLKALDKRLPPNVELESVSEAGTDRYISEAKHRRGIRDIVSAIKIARRNGQKFVRGRA
ncbi:MAG: hypothetical protein QW734_00165 [Candidatus Bathyarchaeia archaeon]|nr:hypothetical protein [Candidatus Bathyarchaeota archaeon]